MKNKLLTIFGSSEGHTSKIAHHIDQQARNLGYHSELLNVQPFKEVSHLANKIRHADMIIIGASIHLGQHQSKIKHLVEEHLHLLQSKPTVFFSVSLMAASPLSEDQNLARKQAFGFAHTHGWQPNQIWTIAGALLYTHYNWLTRIIMKWQVGKHDGDTDTSRDYVYTDWTDLEYKLKRFLYRSEGLAPISHHLGQQLQIA